MKLIKRPDWVLDNHHLEKQFREQVRNWFDTHLKDHYAVHKDDLVRVVAISPWAGANYIWQDAGDVARGNDGQKDKREPHHQAYLIKSSIEPIKQETCADVLRDILSDADKVNFRFMDNYRQRAKAALDRGEDE